jgi:hypothetical protein
MPAARLSPATGQADARRLARSTPGRLPRSCNPLTGTTSDRAVPGAQWSMALSDRIKKFMQSPQGRKMMQTGQRELSKPENQRKLRQIAAKFTKRR